MPIAPRMGRGGEYSFQDEALLPFIRREFTPTPFPSLAQLQDMAAKRGQLTPNEVASFAVDMASPFAKIGGLFGHTVFHGSPYLWAKPSIKKIGTGEGRQVYGHGFYSAESPKVARKYAKELAKKKGTDSYFYELEIPDDQIPNYLNFDKPLNQQSEKVQKALKEMAMGYQVPVVPTSSAEALYDDLVEVIGHPAAVADLLNLYEVPGIRYLDEKSRDAKKGTYNYVTFDPEKMRVLKRVKLK